MFGGFRGIVARVCYFAADPSGDLRGGLPSCFLVGVPM